jgi:hypothetical protein
MKHHGLDLTTGMQKNPTNGIFQFDYKRKEAIFVAHLQQAPQHEHPFRVGNRTGHFSVSNQGVSASILF